MHELNICRDILITLEAQAKQHHFKRIKILWLEIGELANIEIDAIKFSFPIAALNSIAENTLLEIIIIEGQAWCNTCQNNVIIKKYFDPCPQCNQYNYKIICGKDLRILKMEVE